MNIKKRNDILKAIAYILIPATLIYAMWHFNLIIDNFSSIITNIYFKIIALFLILFFAYLLDYPFIKRKYVSLFCLCTLINILIDYNLNNQIFSLIHVLSGYIALFIFNLLCIKILDNKLSAYYLCCGICFSIIIYYGSITGLAEVIYIITSLVLLTKRKTG